MDGPILDSNIERLRASRVELGHLYKEDEQYWAQRSRIQRLNEEDRNTRFFHVRASKRNKRNMTEDLFDSEGNWVSDSRRVCQVALDYFHSLFKTKACGNIERTLGLIPHCITSNINGTLDNSVTNKELVDTFNQMDSRKAQGIDGLLGLFYKEIWRLVGKDVLKLCHEDATRLLDLKAFENLIMVSWNVWNSRNNALFHGKEEDARLIWERARTLGDDFRNFNLSHVALNLRPPRSHRWVKLPIDIININVDATIHDTMVGIGIIARDSDGFVLGGHVVYLDYKMMFSGLRQKP
ncbi:hypothetical protein GOBAR_AA18445 [Gossypium barbadense]|uniref:RNase H type-1 domain-containing protein n=1 Tax=Gossypium barbadense TaxID=3634 RepID=A0A2P5XFU7_GOSBA|nr:hypothetical protein GOBAR_AA18445 [Gossypium barbadense]